MCSSNVSNTNALYKYVSCSTFNTPDGTQVVNQTCPTTGQSNLAVAQQTSYDGSEEHSYHIQSMEMLTTEVPSSSASTVLNSETSFSNLINPLFWNRSATLLLINKFTKHRVGQEAGQYRKKQMWEKVQKEMMSEGYPFNSEQIAGRWKTLMRAYRNSKEPSAKSSTKGKKYEYEDELDALFALDPCIHREADDSISTTIENDINPLFWNKPATLALIKEFRQHKKDQETKQYTMKHLWEKIEHAMMLQGFPYNAEQISGRWKTLMRGYKMSKEYNPSSGKKFKKYEFYDELNALYTSADDDQQTTKDKTGEDVPEVRRRKRRKLRSSAKEDDHESDRNDETPMFWNRSATLMFIDELKKYTVHELGNSRKKRMWHDIRHAMASKGYAFNVDQICGRWKTLLRGYKNAKSTPGLKKYEYHDELDVLFSSESCVLPDWAKNMSRLGSDESDVSDDDNRSPSKPVRHSYCKEAVQLLRQFMEDQNRREKEDIARQERMHRERICILQNLIQAITQNVTLRPSDFM